MNFLKVKKKKLTESIKIETKANVNNKKWLEQYELDINNHNKHYILFKNSQIELDQKQISFIDSFLILIEKNLKIVSDKLLENELLKLNTDESTDIEAYRQLTGVVRVGNFVKNSQLKSERNIELVVLMSTVPNYTIIKEISNEMKLLFINDQNYTIENDDFLIQNEVCLILNFKFKLNDAYLIKIMFTSTTINNNIEFKTNVNIDKCKMALKEVMRIKWFNNMLKPILNSVLILRIMRDLCKRSPTWSVLNDWLLELIIEKCLYKNKYEELSKKLRTVFEMISSGCLFLNLLSIKIKDEKNEGTLLSMIDPCTNKDAFENVLTLQQREDLTSSAQHALRLISFKKINQVLAAD